MAETITIPSSSIFLNSSTEPSPVDKLTKKTKARTQPKPPKDSSKTTERGAITKRKQSKSRNGCITCKAKRLKCDETKPTCQQCARRSVSCGGYKKDFKWRPFEETSFVGGKPAPTKPRKTSPQPTSFPAHFKTEDSIASDDSNNTMSNNDVFRAPYQSPGPTTQNCSPNAFMDAPYSQIGDLFVIPQPSPYMIPPTSLPQLDPFEPSSVESSNSIFDSETIDTRLTKTTAPSSISSGQSPRLVDLLNPIIDLNAPPPGYSGFQPQYVDSFYQPALYHDGTEPMQEDDVEEIQRTFNPSPDHEAWVMRLPSPSPSSSTSSTSDSALLPFYQQPQFSMTSPEMLTRRFDRDTCGILSVKDGPTENPWRTLVWPLARDSPALYHAIASMTSFHQSKDVPMLRIQGIDHMRTSVHALATNLENMRVDAGISTTLVLAFSESWDQHTSTGINHIKGAKLLINRALAQHSQNPLAGDELARLKFLCNVWIYMDVIARLTSVDDDESNDFDFISEMLNLGSLDAQLDPLMGCASTLFPIIGRVANLVRKVRRTNSNSPSIISQAVQLKAQLEDWVPPAFIENPEDETTSIHDSVKTAAAYQYATLLYLHQAVPEIPSLSSAELAKKVLCELATVEPRSRAVIVQIYPLMAAGTESTEQEDREWVQNRWETMAARMKLGIIDRCSDVTKEVWGRRDQYVEEKAQSARNRNGSTSSTTFSLKRAFSDEFDMLDDPFGWVDVSPNNKKRALTGSRSFDVPRAVPIKTERSDGKKRVEVGTERLEVDYTVRGRLHWLGVMKDWGWEVLLG